MRTIRYTFYSALPDNTPGHHHIELSTEVILDSDDEVYDEGRRVKGLFDSFLDGLTDGDED